MLSNAPSGTARNPKFTPPRPYVPRIAITPGAVFTRVPPGSPGCARRTAGAAPADHASRRPRAPSAQAARTHTQVAGRGSRRGGPPAPPSRSARCRRPPVLSGGRRPRGVPPPDLAARRRGECRGALGGDGERPQRQPVVGDGVHVGSMRRRSPRARPGRRAGRDPDVRCSARNRATAASATAR